MECVVYAKMCTDKRNGGGGGRGKKGGEAAEDCGKEAMEFGLKKIRVYVKGPGQGRESAIRTLHNMGIEVMEIVDVTPLPHNGCRPPKRRRV